MTNQDEASSLESAEKSPRVLQTAALLALLAAALRFFRLGDWSLWADEAATLRDAANLRDVITYPVGYAIIGLATKVFGSSEFALRLVPAIAGVATVPSLYLLGRKIISNRAAILAAILLSVSSYHIFFSQFARYYTLVTLFSLIGIWFAFDGFERDSRRSTLIGASFLILATLTHWTAVLAVASLAAYAVWALPAPKRPRGLTLPNVLILFAPFLAGAAIFIRHIVSFLKGWHADSGFSLSRAGLMLLKLLDRLEPAVLIMAAFAIWLILKNRERAGKWLICCALLPPAAAVLFVGFTQGGSRFALISLPAFLLLAAAALDIILQNTLPQAKRIAWTLVALVILSLVLKDAFYFTIQRGQRPRWREAAAYVLPKAHAEHAEVFASSPEVLNYYAQRMHYQVTTAPLPNQMSLPDRPAYLIIEHVANVKPPKDFLDYIQEKSDFEKQFPLTVQFLDYSLSVHKHVARER